ncbi:MAG: hypothetical protein ACYDAQ_08995, partial [Mycobacteriales bacterium]
PGRRRGAAPRLGRGAGALRGAADGWNGSAWRRAAGLGPAAQEWLDLLAFDSGGLVPSSSVLRVTARVTGSDVDERNRMSKGRMALAMLVGDGARAATLNAALHRLGSQVCVAENPACQRCPLRTLCRSAAC